MEEIKADTFVSLKKVESDLENIFECINDLQEFVDSEESKQLNNTENGANLSSVQLAEFMALICFTIDTLTYSMSFNLFVLLF